MKIKIAGAGAGKTTTMAKNIINQYQINPEHKNIYCITFTNNAVECINKKLTNHFGEIPQNIKLSTIHSFLNQEIIKPYYYILFKKQYTQISTIKLDSNHIYKNSKISQLEEKNILHVSVIPQRAKWVIYKKSSDKKKDRETRDLILKNFTKYCGYIFIDEAQDIDKHMVEIIKKFNELSINLNLIGDPKQDLKGTNSLRLLIEEFNDSVEYITTCHRCPQNHLDISNTLFPKNVWQNSSVNYGVISVLFESDLDITAFFNSNSFDLKYISKKNERYSTKNDNYDLRFNTLFYEITCMLDSILDSKNELEIKQLAYHITNQLILKYEETGNEKEAIEIITKYYNIKMHTYNKIVHGLKINNNKTSTQIHISSIDSIKGQEGGNCLFVLTTDLAAYLFQFKKDNNKTKNRLYVALTRSSDKLSILISNEVEIKYGKKFIKNFFENFTL